MKQKFCKQKYQNIRLVEKKDNVRRHILLICVDTARSVIWTSRYQDHLVSASAEK